MCLFLQWILVLCWLFNSVVVVVVVVVVNAYAPLDRSLQCECIINCMFIMVDSV